MFVQSSSFPFSFHKTNRHFIVDDLEKLAKMVRILEKQEVIAFDTETTGVNWHQGDKICGYAFGYKSNQEYFGYYVPVRHITTERQLRPEIVRHMVKPILSNFNIQKIMHNAKFDIHMVLNEDIEIWGGLRDTMIEAHLYNENEPLALKSRVAKDLNDPNAKLFESLIDEELKRLAPLSGCNITGFKEAFGYSSLPPSLCGIYACYDVEFTLRLADFYDRVGVTSVFKRTYAMERELIRNLVNMERNGLPIDREYLEKLRDLSHRTCEGLLPQIHKSIGAEFNVGSDNELRHYLINKVGVPLDKLTLQGEKLRRNQYKTGYVNLDDFRAVDHEALSAFVEDFPVCALILKWREANKIHTTYTDSIIKRIGHDGLLHGELSQVGTNTGRLSSRNPNLQNFASDSDDRAVEHSGKSLEDGGIDPLSVKRAFVVRGEGWVRGYYDYSQIELRVLAALSQDPTMLDVYQKNEDIHKRTQMEVFNDPAKKYRRVAKIINFGLSYCLSASGLARQAKMDRELADEYMQGFFEKYPRIEPFRQELWSQMIRDKGMFINPFGRPRRVPDILSRDERLASSAKRRAIGSLIQGTAAMFTKYAINRCAKWIAETGAPVLPVCTIHDEIQFDIKEDFFPEASFEIVRRMEYFKEMQELNVPVVADVEVTRTNWSEKKEYNLER